MKKLASLVLLGLVLVGCSNSGSGDVMTMEEAQKIALEEVDGEVIKSAKIVMMEEHIMSLKL